MKDFAAPLESARPRGSRLLEAFSPKLGRRVRLFDHRSFRQLLRLEADASVFAFCERPARLRPQSDAPLVDFWVRRGDAESMLLLEPALPQDAIPREVEGVAVHIVSAAEIAADGVWISNWQRMLPVVIATRSLIPKTLTKAVLQRIDAPTPLASVERELSRGDPCLVRGAIFEQLRIGRIAASSLRTQPLTLHTLLEPAA
jgi:hypothetical protein